jgi:hypothetical protein
MPNLNFDTIELFESCRELHIVRTQSEFSQLCGRTAHWFSTCKSKNLPLSTEALLTLSIKLSAAAKSKVPKHLRHRAKVLNQNIATALTERMLDE